MKRLSSEIEIQAPAERVWPILTLEPLAPDRCRFRQREIFTGLLVPLLARSLDRDTMRGSNEMNQALKARAEQSA